jgi:hypothetical protein
MDNAIYPFWNLEQGAESVIRFLPDENNNNTFFWVERQVIKLPFAGVKGETDSKNVIVQVPCNEMFGGTCPVLTEVRPWYKIEGMETQASKYWKKRSYIFQGFVTLDGLNETDVPENPIRRFILTPQVFQLVRAALVDPELEDLPTDYVHGIDFRVKKTSKGGYSDYSTSSWSRKERPLSQSEQEHIEAFGLFDLASFLPKKPTPEELVVIKEMFEASVDGEAYDPERWGQFYKPNGSSQSTETTTAPTSTKVTETPKVIPAAVEEDLPFEPDPPKTDNSRAQAILETIRNRAKVTE